MTPLLAITALMMPPVDGLLEDRCDCIEINTFGSGAGQTQLIFWDHHNSEPDWRVVAWRWWKDNPWGVSKSQRIGRYELQFNDKGTSRQVTSKRFVVTRSVKDREIENRSIWPESKRRGLTRRGT